MIAMWHRWLTLVTILSVIGLLQPSHAQSFELSKQDIFSQQQQFLHVDEAFKFDFRLQDYELQVTWKIADDYYLYQHRFALKNNPKWAHLVSLPEGLPHVDEFFGETIIYRDSVTLTYQLDENLANEPLIITYQGCADAGLCYPPTEKVIYAGATNAQNAPVVSVQSVAANSQQNYSTSWFDEINEQPLWLSLLLFIALGIGLAFTPCVLPMYPIISAIIMGTTGATTSQPRQLTTWRAFTLSLAYVQGMAITYSLLGIVVAFAGLRFQAMLQHPVLLIVIALIFVVLALSMLDVYNIQLPARWQNYLNNLSQKQRGGAHTSVFVIGALSGLIASPCTTAPLSGVLLFIAQSGDLTVGGAVLYALSVGMGLPLLVFGVTGGKLLPKAGAWMNTIKRLFGMILIAVALVLVERLLPYTVADWLWIAFVVLAAAYLIMSGWKDMQRKPAIAFAAVWLVAAATLLYQWWPQSLQHRLPFIEVHSVQEIQQQLALAEVEQQVVMLDLYADWCVACKEFERYTFSKSEVRDAVQGIRLLQADVTEISPENNAILEHYQVLGLPAILFFKNNNELERSRITGFMAADDFAHHVVELRSR